MSHSEKSLWAGIGDSGHTASAVSKQTEDVRAQLVLLLGQDHTLLVVLPTFRMHLPSSIKSFWKHPHEHKEGGVFMVILNLVNNEDAPAHSGRP